MAAIVTLRCGSETDIAFVMATERLEGYGELVGRWPADRHVVAFRDGRHAYFIAESEGTPVGFAILRDWASAEQVTLVKRVAIVRPGQGVGTAMMRALVAEVFAATDTHRLCIGAFPDNLRAPRLRGGRLPGRRRGTWQRFLSGRASRRAGHGDFAAGLGGFGTPRLNRSSQTRFHFSRRCAS